MNLSRWLFEKKACSEDRYTFWNIISMKPRIIYLQGYVKQMMFIHKVLQGKRAFLLRGPIGCEEHPKFSRRWKSYFDKVQRLYPEHRVVFLCNTTSMRDRFQDKGMPGLFCSQNGLLDEKLFSILPGVPKAFDAVYNAQMEKVKRLELAAGIEKLALITYRLQSQPSYYEEMKKTLDHATWLNFDSGEYMWISPQDMSKHLNRARVGVILSKLEGANYAVMEYMLSGLPVVSTESQGGRSVFFDDDYVKIVEDTPAAVADGVREMIFRNVDPYSIRERTIRKMLKHREIFMNLLQQICDGEGIARDMRKEWPDYFFNKMSQWDRMGNLEAVFKTE